MNLQNGWTGMAMASPLSFLSSVAELFRNINGYVGLTSYIITLQCGTEAPLAHVWGKDAFIDYWEILKKL
jgi:hypothetical protein